MLKKLLFLLAVFIASLPAWAETPDECYRKHPDAVCVFFKTPAFKGTLKNFNIERIAFYAKGEPRVALKIVGRDKDIVKSVKDTMKSDEYSIGVIFTDGSALAIDKDFTYMMYMSTKGQYAGFPIDEYRQELYEDVLKSAKE